MSSEKQIEYSTEGSVATITLNNPAIKNAYGFRMVNELGVAIGNSRDDPVIKTAILRGQGDRYFSNGANLTEIAGEDFTAEYRAGLCIDLRDVLDQMKDSETVYIAEINGHAIGGGLEIALACDLRYLGKTDDGNKPFIGFPELSFGLIPVAGGIGNLLYVVGFDTEIALDILTRKDFYNPMEAKNEELVQEVYPHADLHQKVFEEARKFKDVPERFLEYYKKFLRFKVFSGRKVNDELSGFEFMDLNHKYFRDNGKELDIKEVLGREKYKDYNSGQRAALVAIVEAINLNVRESDPAIIKEREVELITGLWGSEYVLEKLAELRTK